jgi:DeoR/GlpR family transcriptional regulator of sugar metabolism
MNPVSSSPRTEKILALLSGRDEVSVAELAEHFAVTPMTIRRDLEALARQGRITRTHGGAFLAAPAVAAFQFQDRRTANPQQKRAIAEAAVALVEPGMTLVLDTGTTTLEVARRLGSVPNLTVLTSSLAIASSLFATPGIELILLGGTVNRNSPDLSGPLTVDNLHRFHPDLAMIGADGVDASGFYTSSLAIAQVSRAIIDSAQRAILLADSGKFDHPAFVRIANWDALDGMVVDEDLGDANRRWLGKVVANLVFAKCSTQGDEK